ncbi:MAG: hypothetical protein V4692_01305 [Bdellovibrionota bacterium]
MSRVGIFKDKDERINLAFPLILIALQITEVAGGFSFFHGMSTGVFYFLADIVFLHLIHTSFSFNMLIRYPEFRAWRFDYGSGNPVRVWWRWLAFALFLFAFFYTSPSFQENKGLFIAIVLVTASIRVQHGITQTRGMAALYDRVLDRSTALDSAARRERFLFNGIFFFMLPHVFVCAPPLEVNVLPFSKETIWAIRTVCVVMCTIFVIGLLVNAWFTDHRTRTSKIPFLLRMFVVPLSFYSVTAIFAFSAVHGIEYFFVTRKIAQATNREPSRFGWITYVAPALVIAAVFAPIYFIKEHPRWLFAFATMISYVHFFMDKELFRFRHTASREHISPLLRAS